MNETKPLRKLTFEQWKQFPTKDRSHTIRGFAARYLDGWHLVNLVPSPPTESCPFCGNPSVRVGYSHACN